MNATLQKALTAATVLGLFSLAGIGVVSAVYNATDARIKVNERNALLRSLRAIVPDAEYDNDIVADITSITELSLGSRHPISVYRARKAGKPVAAVISAIASEGYNGDIKLLVAIRTDGSLAGVRAVAHKETPGLGDAIEEKRSDWILEFSGKSLTNPSEQQWAVKRDGGAFDQFTGATITPRAVVKAVKNSLIYYQNNKVPLFSATELPD